MREEIALRKRPLILVVDDDMTTRYLIRASLEKAGFEVEEAEDGGPALDAFQSLRPDIVLLDVLMPQMDGFAACEAIRQLPGAEYIPIIMVTGLEDTDSINRAYEVGATDFITKPINWTILSYRMRYTLRSFQDLIQRQHLEEQLHQSQKMEAIGRLAGGVAHDFNNILMVILGFCEILLTEFQNEQTVNSQIEEIKKAAEQAASLTSQLLAFSRKQLLQPETFDVRVIMSEMDKMLERIIGEDIQLSTLLGAEPALVTADPGQLKQVIMNVAVNARDAMPRGGKLTIEIANVYLDESYCHQHLEVFPGPYVMLAISDTGIGMDLETQTRIFEPFFTTKGRDKGTGLGLSTVHGIVKQSGGYIWVYSEPGQGTTLKIYFPLAQQAEQGAHPGPCQNLARHGSETILVVEDEALVRRVVRKILQHYGYTVLEAADGQEALSIGEQHPGPINLLFTDVVMPGLSGRELVDRWVSDHPETKVLFTSGYTENAIVHHGNIDPEINFIQKPYRPDMLAVKVREVLDLHSLPRKDLHWR